MSPYQSGFRSRESFINRLLSINDEILNAFDKGLDVCGIFIDISKVFDNYDMMVLFLNYVKMV